MAFLFFNLLKKIKQVSNYKFFYNESPLELNRKVSLLWRLIDHHSSKILLEYSRSFFKLFGGIFFYIFQFAE